MKEERDAFMQLLWHLSHLLGEKPGTFCERSISEHTGQRARRAPPTFSLFCAVALAMTSHELLHIFLSLSAVATHSSFQGGCKKKSCVMLLSCTPTRTRLPAAMKVFWKRDIDCFLLLHLLTKAVLWVKFFCRLNNVTSRHGKVLLFKKQPQLILHTSVRQK